MVIKICEIRSKKVRETMMGRIYGKKVSLSLEWNWDGVMHSESDDDDVDDDELVRERWDGS